MRWRLITVGNPKLSWIKEGESMYRMRLQPWLKIETVVVPDTPVEKNMLRTAAVQAEGEKLLAALSPTAQVVVLDVEGQWRTSDQVAAWLGERKDQGQDVDFVIGGPYGIAPAVVARAQWRWSLSPLTFTHELARLLWWEQMYRAFSILHQRPYHH